MYRRALACAALLAIALLPVRTQVARAGILQMCVVGAPVSTAALDNPGVLAEAFNLGSDFNPGVRSFYNFTVVRVYLYNAGSVPFAYSPADFTLEDPAHGIIYTPAGGDDGAIQATQLTAGTLQPGAIVAGDIAFRVYADYDIAAAYILHWSHSTIPVPFDCI